MNEFLRHLNRVPIPNGKYPMWSEEGDILITPEGDRWRIERTPTVADLIHVGDVIKTSYDTKWDTGGIVIRVARYTHCCCPRRAVSGVLYCFESWDEPPQTAEYHRELISWSIIYVRPEAPQTKSGKFHERDYCYINELVTAENRILKLYEANDDEVFVINKKMNIKPMQLDLL